MRSVSIGTLRTPSVLSCRYAEFGAEGGIKARKRSVSNLCCDLFHRAVGACQQLSRLVKTDVDEKLTEAGSVELTKNAIELTGGEVQKACHILLGDLLARMMVEIILNAHLSGYRAVVVFLFFGVFRDLKAVAQGAEQQNVALHQQSGCQCFRRGKR